MENETIIEILPAKVDDYVDIQKLLMQLGWNLNENQVKRNISIYIKQELYSILVAKQEGVILGFITMNCYDTFVSEGRCLHIEAIIIDEKYRNKGIGKKFIKAAEDFARSNNCIYSELITLDKRRKDGTHDFYKNLGYEDSEKTNISYFCKDLD